MRYHPTQADLSCLDFLSHCVFVRENPKAWKTGSSDRKDNSSQASKYDSHLFRGSENSGKNFLQTFLMPWDEYYAMEG